MDKRWANALYCMIMCHFAMVITVISPLLIEITRAYSLSMAQAGWIFTLNFLGFVIFVFTGGLVADHFGKKTAILASLAGFSISLALVLFTPNYRVFCILIFFIGGFGGIIEAVVSSAVSELNDKNATFYQNLVHSFFGVGALVGPVTAGVLVTAGMDWRVCFLILGVLGALLTGAFLLTKLPNRPSENGFSAASFMELVRDPAFMVICLCIFLYTGAEVGSWGWMSLFLKQNLGFSLTRASVAVGVFWIAITVGRFACGQLTLRFKPSSIIITLAFSAFAVTLSSLFIKSEILTWMQIVLMGLSFSSLWPLIVGYGGEHRKTSSSTVFSLLVGCGGIGATAIPFLMGLAGSATDARIPMLIPSVSLLLVGVFFTVLIRKKNAGAAA